MHSDITLLSTGMPNIAMSLSVSMSVRSHLKKDILKLI